MSGRGDRETSNLCLFDGSAEKKGAQGVDCGAPEQRCCSQVTAMRVAPFFPGPTYLTGRGRPKGEWCGAPPLAATF
jgi:hypothetical protein